MLRGQPVALFVSALYALTLASERVARVRAWRHFSILRELVPVLAATLAVHAAAHWFASVADVRTPQFLPALVVAAAFALPAAVAKNLRVRRIVAGLTIVGMSFLGLADALYFRFFGGILPLLGAANAKQAWEVMSSIVALLMPRDAVFVVLAASGVWLAASRPVAEPSASPRTTRRVWASALIATVLASAFLINDVRSWLSQRHSQKILSWTARMHQTGLFGSHARDVARLVRASREARDPAPERVQEIARYLESHREAPPAELFGVARGKNLIVIQVEALQQWVIGTRAHNVEITPFLNGLIHDRALYFDSVWDQTMVSPTADSEFMAMNSLQPMPDSAIVFRYSTNDFVALPGVMVREGYSTLSAHAFERGFWNRATVHPRYGFQRSYFDRELGRGQKLGWGLADKTFLLRALERVDATRAPFMGLFITLTSHHPYTYLPPGERHIDVSGLPEMLGGYVASMRYVDEALSGFFQALATRPYAKDTVVVIYGDHESKLFLDRADAARALEILSLDALSVKDLARRSFATRKIPLIAVLPDAKQGRVFSGVGGQMDISPTILHLFGIQQPKSMMGRPLVAAGGAVFRGEGSAVEGGRVRLADGNCRTLGGSGLRVEECESLAKRGREQLEMSWAITQYNLAGRLSGERRASR